MRELLTARQVQQLLRIDRSTVYRMAADGRLPSVRVGKQLRFSADELEGLAPVGPERHSAEAGIAVLADMLGVTMVVTDMGGQPVTRIVNPSPWFCAAGADDLRGCLLEWRTLADDPDLAPRFVSSGAGFDCARAFIRTGSTLTGMVLAGGIASADSARPDQFHQLDDAGRAEVLRMLPRIAAALGAQRTTPLEIKESL